MNTTSLIETAQVIEDMVAPGRVELPTFGLGNRCSIHLSYGAKVLLSQELLYSCAFSGGTFGAH